MRATRSLCALLLLGGSVAFAASPAPHARSAWLSFPSGVSVEKVLDGPLRDERGNEIGIVFAYAAEPRSEPFDGKIVAAVRDYLSAKYPGVPRVTLVTWTRGDDLASQQSRTFIRGPNGRWRLHHDPRRVNVAAPAASEPPLAHDQVAEAAASRAIAGWMGAFDRRDLATCWAATVGDFRTGLTESEWRARAATLSDRLGQRISRRELAREYGRLPEGARRTYVTIEYRSAYRRASAVLERVTATRCEAAGWCILGWDLRASDE